MVRFQERAVKKKKSPVQAKAQTGRGIKWGLNPYMQTSGRSADVHNLLSSDFTNFSIIFSLVSSGDISISRFTQIRLKVLSAIVDRSLYVSSHASVFFFSRFTFYPQKQKAFQITLNYHKRVWDYTRLTETYFPSDTSDTRS